MNFYAADRLYLFFESLCNSQTHLLYSNAFIVTTDAKSI